MKFKGERWTIVYCEAWHTGAETIASLAEEGTKITVNATAKNVKDEEDLIIFRINEFDLPCLDNDWGGQEWEKRESYFVAKLHF